jgi:hypothetical protein
MMFAAAVGHRSGRATPSLRDAPQRQSMEIVGRETIYRNRNAVQTNPATSEVGQMYAADIAFYTKTIKRSCAFPMARSGQPRADESSATKAVSET